MEANDLSRRTSPSPGEAGLRKQFTQPLRRQHLNRTVDEQNADGSILIHREPFMNRNGRCGRLDFLEQRARPDIDER